MTTTEWILCGIIVYLLIGFIIWIWSVCTDRWGGFLLYPVFALLIIVGWLPLTIRNVIELISEKYKKWKGRV
ncbi:hypothetical protein COM24_07530 [Bacillus toyonensis]|uniref:hypothetical protein n=1 Tax=Bacillus toyonensis TaxID=155322 RepID=UPI000BF9B9CD|nr:hypothetical protein [Bacillus toyonensis]PGC56653.1 hypothetical protein COM24_07530 [Bacillus toyonensis]